MGKIPIEYVLSFKARNILEKDADTKSCISSDSFLVLFHIQTSGTSSADVMNATTTGASATTTSTGNNITNNTSSVLMES